MQWRASGYSQKHLQAFNRNYSAIYDCKTTTDEVLITGDGNESIQGGRDTAS